MYLLSLMAIDFLTCPKILACELSICGSFILCEFLLPYRFMVAQTSTLELHSFKASLKLG